MEMTMARAKKTPDYLNLPFEVYFKRMSVYGYELIHEIGKNPKNPDDYIGVIYKNIRSFGVTFRSANKGDGSLIYVLGGRLDDLAPNWLEFIDDEDQDVKSETKEKFEIVDGQFIRGDDIDDDDLDDFDYDTSWEFFSCEGETPAYLVLDADGSRVMVDSEGYCLAEDDSRIGEKPLVEFTEDELYAVDLSNNDFDDVSEEIGKYFKK
jgi:hypothetical protein